MAKKDLTGEILATAGSGIVWGYIIAWILNSFFLQLDITRNFIALGVLILLMATGLIPFFKPK